MDFTLRCTPFKNNQFNSTAGKGLCTVKNRAYVLKIPSMFEALVDDQPQPFQIDREH